MCLYRFINGRECRPVLVEESVYTYYILSKKTSESMLCPYFLLEKGVKQKFNSLSSYYSNGLAKSSAKSGAGTDEVYQSKWPFFHSLEFLRDSIFPRKTTLSFVSIL